jgi:hypothetical protein
MELSLDRIDKELDKVFSFIESGQITKLENKVREYKDEENGPFFKFIQGDEYPDIEFTISKNEFEQVSEFVELLSDNTVNKPAKIADFLSGNALGKFFYALAWKQGDLIKLDTLLDGLKRVHQENATSLENGSLVFPQFGAHLADPAEQPIIDQHIIRAFNYYELVISDEREITYQLMNSGNNKVAKNKARDRNIFRFKEEDVSAYLKWLKSNIDHVNQEKKRKALRTIDKCLFTLGKALNTNTVKAQLKRECKS